MELSAAYPTRVGHNDIIEQRRRGKWRKSATKKRAGRAMGSLPSLLPRGGGNVAQRGSMELVKPSQRRKRRTIPRAGANG